MYTNYTGGFCYYGPVYMMGDNSRSIESSYIVGG